MIEHRALIMPSFAAVYGLGFAPLLVLPFMIGAAVTGIGIDAGQAGLLATLELMFMCCLSFLLAPVIGHLPRRSIAIMGGVIIIAANLACMLVSSYQWIIIFRCMAGIGSGMALASGNATIASSTASDKLYNKVVFRGTILLVGLLLVTPFLIERWAQNGIYGLLAIVAIAMLLLLIKLPQYPIVSNTDQVQASRYRELSVLPALAVLVMIFTYFVRDTMVWAFAERIASERLGLSIETISILFGLHGGLSLLGPLVAAWIGLRFGRKSPLLGGIVITGIITYLANITDSNITYGSMVIIWAAAHFFTYSYMMGLASVMDRQGRVVTAAGGAVLFGTALAPAISGNLLKIWDYGSLGLVIIGMVILTLLTGTYAVNSVKEELDTH